MGTCPLCRSEISCVTITEGEKRLVEWIARTFHFQCKNQYELMCSGYRFWYLFSDFDFMTMREEEEILNN